MIGQVGVTAATMLLIELPEHYLQTLVSLCNNPVDSESLKILKNELRYLQQYLDDLDYTYLTRRGTEAVPDEKLNRLSKRLKYSDPKSDKYSEMKKEFDNLLETTVYQTKISNIQTVNGNQIVLSDIAAKILETLAERKPRIEQYLKVLDQGDFVHNTAVAFRQKLYQLPNRSSLSIYRSVERMVGGKTTLRPAEIQEIEESARMVADRFEKGGTEVDAGIYKDLKSILNRYSISHVEKRHEDSEEFDRFHTMVEDRYSGEDNEDEYFSVIMNTARELFYIDSNEELLNKIFGTSGVTLGEFEEAYKNLDEAGVPGLSVYNFKILEDAFGASTWVSYLDVSFPRVDLENGSRFGEVIDNVLAFTECLKTPAWTEIGG